MGPGSPVATEISCEEAYFDAVQTLHKRCSSCKSSVAPASSAKDHHNNLTLCDEVFLQSQKIQSSRVDATKSINNVIDTSDRPARDNGIALQRDSRQRRPLSESTFTSDSHSEDAAEDINRSSDSGDHSGVAQNGLCDTHLQDEDLPIIPGAFESARSKPYSSRLESAEPASHLEEHSSTSLAQDEVYTPIEHHWLHRGFLHASERAHDHLKMEDDLFIDAAEDVRPRPRRAENASNHAKRLSLPQSELRALTAMDNRRPRTSGGPASARPGSRLDEIRSSFRSKIEGHQRSPSAATYTGLPEGVTVRPRRNSRYSIADQPSSPLSPSRRAVRSPDMSIFGRSATALGTRRGSQLAALRRGSDAESPAESIEQKVESVSAESQTAPSTVWDELDDLKSRIKKLELTGKLPSTSGAAMGGGSQPERPRTATTAPTTIDSSPKRDKTQQVDVTAPEQAPATPTSTETHPLLHAALAKAKPLLNPSLYRSLEASAADALQLAAMTGVPAATAGQLVNGGSSVDRAIRRKADSMCRNLTELCLALCEGKHDPSSLPASPMNTAVPSGRLSRMSTARTEVQGRPMSRLEARRRSSILGDADRKHISPAREDSSDQGSLPPQQSTLERQRFARPSSRLTAARSRFGDFDDEDPTIRPPSRVGSEFSFRSKRTLDTRNAPAATPHRSFSLREALTNRRASGQGLEEQRGLTRVASMSSEAGRPRWARESTPPVLEEDIGEQEVETSQSSRPSRLASLAHMKLGPRRVFTDAAARASSLSGRSRRVAVE